jgi:hypothetical protein
VIHQRSIIAFSAFHCIILHIFPSGQRKFYLKACLFILYRRKCIILYYSSSYYHHIYKLTYNAKLYENFLFGIWKNWGGFSFFSEKFNLIFFVGLLFDNCILLYATCYNLISIRLNFFFFSNSIFLLSKTHYFIRFRSKQFFNQNVLEDETIPRIFKSSHRLSCRSIGKFHFILNRENYILRVNFSNRNKV